MVYSNWQFDDQNYPIQIPISVTVTVVNIPGDDDAVLYQHIVVW